MYCTPPYVAIKRDCIEGMNHGLVLGDHQPGGAEYMQIYMCIRVPCGCPNSPAHGAALRPPARCAQRLRRLAPPPPGKSQPHSAGSGCPGGAAPVLAHSHYFGGGVPPPPPPPRDGLGSGASGSSAGPEGVGPGLECPPAGHGDAPSGAARGGARSGSAVASGASPCYCKHSAVYRGRFSSTISVHLELSKSCREGSAALRGVREGGGGNQNQEKPRPYDKMDTSP